METVIVLGILGYVCWRIYKSKQKRQIENSATFLMNETLRMIEEKRAKIETKGIPYIHHNLKEGISQMVDFPYKTYEEWNAVYRKAAIESNPALEPIISEGGVAISVLDFLDDEPCRRAYHHHLNPKILGKKFGEIFDPLNVSFEDGVTTREFLNEELLKEVKDKIIHGEKK
jgi:hypothetical protein